MHPLCLLCCAAGHDAQKRCQEAALDCAEGLDNPACLKVRFWATCCRQWLSGVGGWACLGAYLLPNLNYKLCAILYLCCTACR